VNDRDELRVAIAAWSEPACAEIEALLASTQDLRFVGAAPLPELADLLDRTSPDVLIIDLGSDPEAPIAIAAGVVLPATVVLGWGAASDRPPIEAGVRAVLLDRLPGGRLLAAVRAVAMGLLVFDEGAMVPGFPGGDDRRREPERVETLTAREGEVLQLLAEGLSNKEIARSLEISEHTVKFHLSAVFGKLGAASRTEAVATGIRRGLVMI
jgi:DNA-binding NarL/FixJ family response regulator